jgi:hypothetical protein
MGMTSWNMQDAANVTMMRTSTVMISLWCFSTVAEIAAMARSPNEFQFRHFSPSGSTERSVASDPRLWAGLLSVAALPIYAVIMMRTTQMGGLDWIVWLDAPRSRAADRPKGIQIEFIARMNWDFLKAQLGGSRSPQRAAGAQKL